MSGKAGGALFAGDATAQAPISVSDTPLSYVLPRAGAVFLDCAFAAPYAPMQHAGENSGPNRPASLVFFLSTGSIPIRLARSGLQAGALAGFLAPSGPAT
jgi:hypothetical protein